MENYEIYSILGKGTYAIVYGGIHKVNSKHFALKVFNLNTPTHIVRNEVQVMRHLMTYKIDNVVEVEEIFTNDNGQYVLVMEKLAGGELFDRIIERGSFSERDAAACMKTFIHALHKLHTQVGLIHRDLKPENIVYIDRTRNSDIKIVDFGLSIICNPTNAATGVICKDMVGTIGYMAPESIQRLCYSAESDVWSAGVILYCILTGIPPFNSEDKHISQRIVHGQYYPMNTTYWDGISEEAKDLVKQMLTVDPMKRITVQGVLNHPWITQHTSIASNVNLGAQYIKRIAKLSSRQKFRKVVNGIIWANRLRKSHLWGILSKGTANNDANALTKASSKVSTKLSKTESKAAKETDENVVPDEEPKQIQYFTNEQLNLLRQKFVTAAKQSAINRANTNANSSNPDTNTATTENEDIGYDEFCSIVESVD